MQESKFYEKSSSNKKRVKLILIDAESANATMRSPLWSTGGSFHLLSPMATQRRTLRSTSPWTPMPRTSRGANVGAGTAREFDLGSASPRTRRLEDLRRGLQQRHQDGGWRRRRGHGRAHGGAAADERRVAGPWREREKKREIEGDRAGMAVGGGAAGGRAGMAIGGGAASERRGDRREIEEGERTGDAGRRRGGRRERCRGKEGDRVGDARQGRGGGALLPGGGSRALAADARAGPVGLAGAREDKRGWARRV
jgi:hypothetical protein